MKTTTLLKTSLALAIIFIAGACNKNGDLNIKQTGHPELLTKEMMSENGTNRDEGSITESLGSISAAVSRSEVSSSSGGHYLYTESNEVGTNAILMYKINHDGSLSLKGVTGSGGSGTGKALGSQGALALDTNHEWLYAVNAGNNSVSSFKVNTDGSLTLAHTENSHGKTPVSVTVHGDLVYVLNRGSDNICGLRISSGGTLTQIPGSAKSLSGTAVDAPQISFTPGGDRVVVTEKATNVISTFRIKLDGSVYSGVFTPSVGNTPFGFGFSRDEFMIVSNAAGGGAGAGSTSSYVVNRGIPKDLNGAIPNFQSAPCWIGITKYGSFAFATNTASNNISSYYVAPWGGLYLVQGEAAKTGMSPVDIVVAANNYYVYELNTKSNTIGGYRRKFFGGLESISSLPGIPLPATGLATF